ncbi:hypothetical protein [Hyalangium gracile]|uniref:hypothetical protein n=1 Tax=Hyalangium gracile TaxID=394092 RepID=UPI001CCFF2CB|nr:hypothetical protein [Hyalangium gracile]
MGLVSTVLIALAPAGCRKDPGPPSPEYEQAHQRFSKLYGQKLDEAFLEPEMEEIEALLQQVPADSIDAPSAKELQQRIANGRAKMEQARKEREAAIAAAQEVPDLPPSTPTAEPEPEPAPAPAAPEDAGVVDSGPVVGSAASALSGGYLGCFQSIRPINVVGKGMRDAWEMSDRARCSQVYPAFVGQVLLIEDGKVLAMLPKDSVRVTYQLADGGTTTGNPNADAGR